MAFDQVLSVIGQIATWVTVVLVFLTLREMERQRKASQKPDLILPKAPIYGYASTDKSKLLVPTEWSNKKLKEGETLIRDFPYITLYNIGLGAAKNIKLKWNFDLESILQTIKDYCYENAIPIFVDKQKGFLRMDLKGLVSMHNIDVSRWQEHDYAIPAATTPHGLRSYLPPAFMGLLSVLVYMMIHQADNRKASSEPKSPLEFPSANLELVYEDIGNTRYIKKFEMKFSIFVLSVPHERLGGEEVIQGMFEFIEKS